MSNDRLASVVANWGLGMLALGGGGQALAHIARWRANGRVLSVLRSVHQKLQNITD